MRAKEPYHHHYVPQYYLKRFCDPKSGLIFGMNRTNRGIIRTGVQVVAVQKYLYDYTEVPNLRSIEQNTANMDGVHASTVGAALERMRLGEAIELQDRAWIAYNMAFQHSRIPKTIREVEEFVQTVRQASADGILSFNPPDGPVVPMNPIQPLSRDRVNALAHLFFLRFHENDEVINKVLGRNWRFYMATPKMPFITSDAPVVLTSTNGITPGLGSVNGQVLFPLSPTWLAVSSYDAFRGGPQRNGACVWAPTEVIIRANEYQLLNCDRFAFARSEADFQPASRVVGAGLSPGAPSTLIEHGKMRKGEFIRIRGANEPLEAFL